MYSCYPHSPWRQGNCQNTNGLLRQYRPKGPGLAVYSQDQLAAIADQLNRLPRESHDFRSPLRADQDVLQAQSQAESAVKH